MKIVIETRDKAENYENQDYAVNYISDNACHGNHKCCCGSDKSKKGKKQ